MSIENFEALTVENIIDELEITKNTKNQTKLDLLKHYLLNFILYSNLNDDEKVDSPIREKLLKISILLEKLVQMEGKLSNVDSKRVIEERMTKRNNKHRNSKSATPGKKFRLNSESLRERTKPKEDLNIRFKKSKKD